MRPYVYALLAEAPRGDAGAGLGAEPLRFVPIAGVLAAVGDMAAPPIVSSGTLRAHDAVVRRLAAAVDAILPVRFGTVLDEAALAEAIVGRAARLREALTLVAGREQMTLRLFGDASASAPSAPVADADVGPGVRYLEDRRRRARREAEVTELAPLRRHLEPLVRAEQAQRHPTPPLLASVYHLVDRGCAPAYMDAVAAGAAALAPTRAVATGPWPPYAFAPSELG